MATAKVTYLGELRTEMQHLQSGSLVITDAPVDNHGKGEAFSPTDLTAASLASCMFTIMGIKLQSIQKDIKGATAEVTKVMYDDPRRIGEILIDIKIPEQDFTDKEKQMLINITKTCPVAKSLHPDIKQVVNVSFTKP